MTNAFETFAETNKPAFQVRAERSASKRARTLEQKQKEEAQLRKSYNAAKKVELDAILAGPFGPEMIALRKILRTLTIQSAPGLVTYIDGRDALIEAPLEVRHVALGLIGKAITRVRLNGGLDPYDDGIPGDEPRAFHLIKSILAVR